jgi:hypothetical protein
VYRAGVATVPGQDTTIAEAGAGAGALDTSVGGGALAALCLDSPAGAGAGAADPAPEAGPGSPVRAEAGPSSTPLRRSARAASRTPGKAAAEPAPAGGAGAIASKRRALRAKLAELKSP